MAGDLSKPDKVHTLFPEEISLKMWPLPVDEKLKMERYAKDIHPTELRRMEYEQQTLF